MKPINGQQSSVLALLAQVPKSERKKIRHVIRGLKGPALLIAKVLIGDSRGTPSARKAAKGLEQWAQGLSRKGSKDG